MMTPLDMDQYKIGVNGAGKMTNKAKIDQFPELGQVVEQNQESNRAIIGVFNTETAKNVVSWRRRFFSLCGFSRPPLISLYGLLIIGGPECHLGQPAGKHGDCERNL